MGYDQYSRLKQRAFTWEIKRVGGERAIAPGLPDLQLQGIYNWKGLCNCSDFTVASRKSHMAPEPPSSFFPLFFVLPKLRLGVLAKTVRQEKEWKDIKIRKKDIKMLTFTDYMSFYVKSPQELNTHTHTFLVLISAYSKVSGYNLGINIQSQLFSSILSRNNWTIKYKTPQYLH
jgi:hypothetical protein